MKTSLTCTKLTLLTVAAVFFQIIGLLLFVLGFFPVKPALSGISGAESFRPPGCNSDEYQNVTDLPPHQLKSLYRDLSEIPPLFDRLIFMVIDGLPAEFVLGKDGQPPAKALRDAMPYTRSLLAKGMATGYHAKAAPPTVTMPRLKAMVSGAIGGFLDVAFNFNTQALLDDNLIGKFLRIGWKMVMLGDETWLKLFPALFARHDGVSSFFVKDTVQVDYNVSRHLSDELSRTDWNLLVLHYLGLDHVGHIGGRNSVLMAPKLKEMDEVVKMIHSSTIQTQGNNEGRTLLVVVSDHGMTENGNHGGSSYEETDSLALFIGLRKYDYASVAYNTVNQILHLHCPIGCVDLLRAALCLHEDKLVDLAATLALLFGVPIPSNNVGNLIAESFHSLTDEQQLRALELNSWQLLRLIQVQLPNLLCGSFSCHDIGDDHGNHKYDGNVEEICFCLYQDAAALHKSWKLKLVTRSNSKDDYIKTVSAYREFLTTASEWLSRRATYKPFGLLASGFMAMLLSCLVLLSLLLLLGDEVYPRKKSIHKWHLADTFTLAVILIIVLSMGSSSMVEEEQYIWHFMSSTFFLVLLRKVLQSFTAGNAQSPLRVVGDCSRRKYCQLSSIIVILVCGRVLRGWHQGGVNWTSLPDISKWLEAAGSGYIKSTQLVSTLLVICVGIYALSSLWSKSKFVMVIGFIFVCPGFLILQHMRKHQDITASDNGATALAQLIYAILAISTFGTVIASPWIMSFQKLKTCIRHDLTDLSPGTQSKDQLVVIKDSIYLIGWGYIFSWCLLQLLLQQPINSMPILLLLVQILASISCASNSDPHVKQWVEIAALYYLGMAGHFGFGNTNTLATIDVAGAFIGISSYSTLLSGVLMFIITYAAPMLALLSITMHISVKDLSSVVGPRNADLGQLLKLTLGFPCLVPLGLNSVLLTAYTIVLLLMRNHLFVWSVFSPKYLYVCATTACVYLGVCIVASTVTYTLMSTALWSALQGSNRER